MGSGGELLPARLLPENRIWSRMLWLCFETADRRFWVLLPPDAVPADGFRRPQGRLRMAARRTGRNLQS